MPTLYILAGPNGAVKTTFYQTAIVMAELVNGTVINKEDNLPQWVIQSLSIIEKLNKGSL